MWFFFLSLAIYHNWMQNHLDCIGVSLWGASTKFRPRRRAWWGYTEDVLVSSLYLLWRTDNNHHTTWCDLWCFLLFLCNWRSLRGLSSSGRKMTYVAEKCLPLGVQCFHTCTSLNTDHFTNSVHVIHPGQTKETLGDEWMVKWRGRTLSWPGDPLSPDKAQLFIDVINVFLLLPPPSFPQCAKQASLDPQRLKSRSHFVVFYSSPWILFQWELHILVWCTHLFYIFVTCLFNR